MKIVFVNRYFHPDHSATSQMLSDLAFFLSGAGYDVSVITSRQRYDDPDASLPQEETIDDVRVVRVATTRFGRDSLPGRAIDYATFYFAARRALCRLVGRGDIVVAKTDPPLISVVADQVARARGALLVNWVQDLFPEVAAALGVLALRGPHARLLTWLRDRALRAAAANVVVGERMGEAVALHGAPAASLHIIHNWADASAIHPVTPSDNPLRREWRLGDEFVASYSGNMGRAHDFATILDAAERLQSNFRAAKGGAVDATRAVVPAVRFVFIGGGPQRRAVEAEAVGRSLANVSFLPYQARAALSHSLGVGDVHLVSLQPQLEGFIVPSKLYGILAVGRPTVFIGDPDGEIARIINSARIGFVIEPGDTESLVDRLLELARDKALREDMGSRARALLRERYDVRLGLGQWKAVIDRVAREAQARSASPTGLRALPLP